LVAATPRCEEAQNPGADHGSRTGGQFCFFFPSRALIQQ